MKSLALVVAGVLVALGLGALVIPEVLIGIGRNMVSTTGLYAAGAVRVGIGLVLMLAARESRAPGLLRAIGDYGPCLATSCISLRLMICLMRYSVALASARRSSREKS